VRFLRKFLVLLAARPACLRYSRNPARPACETGTRNHRI